MRALILLTALLALTGCGAAVPAGHGYAPRPAASPAGTSCPGQATPAETEGPYFKAGSPERSSLVDPGLPGTRVVVSGRVVTLDCRPLPGVVLDFWQADAAGVYDNAGYRLRGHLVTDAGGRYSLETIVPGEYPGRTQHIHVKVEAPGRPVLTTQLYFPGADRNQEDSLFNAALLMRVIDASGRKVATFDFVLNFR